MRIKTTLVGGGLVALSAFGAAVYVSAHGGDTTRVHACVKQEGSGSIRIIAATATCKSNETALDWSVVGPGSGGGLRVVDFGGIDLGTLVDEQNGEAQIFLSSVGVVSRIVGDGGGRIQIASLGENIYWTQPNCTGLPYIPDGEALFLHTVLPGANAQTYWRAVPGSPSVDVIFYSVTGFTGCDSGNAGSFRGVLVENVTNLIPFSADGNPYIGIAPYRVVSQ